MNEGTVHDDLLQLPNCRKCLQSFHFFIFIMHKLKTFNTGVALIIHITHVRDMCKNITVEPQWLEHLRDYRNSFETCVVRATEGNHGTS